MQLKKQPVKPDWLPVLSMRLNGRVPESWEGFLTISQKPFAD
jgi:hypothetical protein